MEWLATVAVAVVLGSLVAYLLRTQGQDRDAFLRAVSLSIQEGSKERESHRLQISEAWERIQHPEIPRPPLHAVETGPPPEPDEAFERAGRIFPENNGDSEGA